MLVMASPHYMENGCTGADHARRWFQDLHQFNSGLPFSLLNRPDADMFAGDGERDKTALLPGSLPIPPPP